MAKQINSLLGQMLAEEVAITLKIARCAASPAGHVWGAPHIFQFDAGRGLRWYSRTPCTKCPALKWDGEVRKS